MSPGFIGNPVYRGSPLGGSNPSPSFGCTQGPGARRGIASGKKSAVDCWKLGGGTSGAILGVGRAEARGSTP